MTLVGMTGKQERSYKPDRSYTIKDNEGYPRYRVKDKIIYDNKGYPRYYIKDNGIYDNEGYRRYQIERED